jgi:hypothetical protein
LKIVINEYLFAASTQDPKSGPKKLLKAKIKTWTSEKRPLEKYRKNLNLARNMIIKYFT